MLRHMQLPVLPAVLAQLNGHAPFKQPQFHELCVQKRTHHNCAGSLS
jgi:hypothetical protein